MARREAGRRARRETLAEAELPEVAVPAAAFAALDRLSLERALRSIAEPVREALWLHHIEGVSCRDAVAVPGISDASSQVRAHRAIAALRGQFAERSS